MIGGCSELRTYFFGSFRAREPLQCALPLDVAVLDFCDPLVLTAVCSFVNNLLENDAIEFREENLQYVVQRLKYFSPLLPVLGDHKYRQISVYLTGQ